MKNTRPQSGLNAYQKTDVLTANKETVLLMLYAAAVRSMKQAIEADEKKEIETKAKHISKVQEILTELRSTLNFDIGGEFAQRMESLYIYLSEKISEAVLTAKREPLLEVHQILNSLNDAWTQAVDNVRQEKAKKSETP